MRAKRVHQLRKEHGVSKEAKSFMRKIKKAWNLIPRNQRKSSSSTNE